MLPSRTALQAVILAAASAASPPSLTAAGVPVEAARERRDRLVAELRKELRSGESGVFHLRGAEADDLEEFRQDSSFYYLTGLEKSGAGMLISFDETSMVESLFLPARDPAAERWSGVALGPGGVDPTTLAPDGDRRRTLEATGFRGGGKGGSAGVEAIAAMRAALSARLGAGAALFLAYEPPALDDPPTRESALVAEVRARYPQVRIVPAGAALARLRVVKSAEEIEAIRKAAAITCEAQRAAMRTVRPGMKEHEVEAIVEYVFTRAGGRFPSFPTIVGSGPNACTLHYDRNDRTIRDGDLVLLDAGAEYAHYAADVTRTLPASGRFSDEQRRVYDAVLRAQSEARRLVRPGARIADIQARTAKVLDEEGFGDRFLHGCCHFVGLDVHDVGDRSTPLAPGMVLTVEPGVYIAEKGIGVRIEDMFLITEGGYEPLSDCVPSDPAQVESEMSRRVALPDFAGAAGSPTLP